MTPEDDVDAVPVSRPWASRHVVLVPDVLDVPVILPCTSRKVVLPVLDCEAVPVVLPCASRNVVLVPDVLVVVEDLPFSSLTVAFLPAREEAGSAKARTGNRRTRISFMDGLDDDGGNYLHLPFNGVIFSTTKRQHRALLPGLCICG